MNVSVETYVDAMHAMSTKAMYVDASNMVLPNVMNWHTTPSLTRDITLLQKVEFFFFYHSYTFFTLTTRIKK